MKCRDDELVVVVVVAVVDVEVDVVVDVVLVDVVDVVVEVVLIDVVVDVEVEVELVDVVDVALVAVVEVPVVVCTVVFNTPKSHCCHVYFKLIGIHTCQKKYRQKCPNQNQTNHSREDHEKSNARSETTDNKTLPRRRLDVFLIYRLSARRFFLFRIFLPRAFRFWAAVRSETISAASKNPVPCVNGWSTVWTVG